MDAAVTLIHCFVTCSSQIEYRNGLLLGLLKYQLGKLQKVQNTAVRLVIMKGKFCGNTTPVLLQLHWLPVLLRMNFKI